VGILLLLLGRSGEDWIKKFSGPEENTVRRAMSRDCVSNCAWSISDTSGHVLDAWSRQIRNQDYASVRIVFVRLNVLDNFVWNITANDFYNVVGYSLPRCDVRLHMEYKYTVVQINTQYNVFVSWMSLIVTLFQLHFPGIQSIRWCDF